MTDDPLRRLRRATRGLHTAVEAEPLLARLAVRGCREADYRAGMAALAAIYTDIDAALLGAEAWRPANIAAYQPRSPTIVAELGRLGAVPGARGPRLPVVDGPGGYLGARYVVDGAQFGHRVIAATLRHSPVAAWAGHEHSFWQARFVEREHWGALCAALTGLDDRDQTARALWAGRRVFRYFQTVLRLNAPLERAA